MSSSTMIMPSLKIWFVFLSAVSLASAHAQARELIVLDGASASRTFEGIGLQVRGRLPSMGCEWDETQSRRR